MTGRLMRAKSAILHAMILAVALSSSGCTTGPATAAAPPVACVLLSASQIGQYGLSRAVNPFFPRASLVRKAADEFVVLQLNLSLSEPTRIAIGGAVRDTAGNEVARLQSLSQMQEYWRFGEDVSDRDARSRMDSLTRYYAPALQFAPRRGRHEYIVVLLGKNPLPRPATAVLSVSLNDAESQSFTFPLPALK